MAAAMRSSGDHVGAAAEVDAELLGAGPHRDEGVVHAGAQPLGERALVPRVALAALRPLEVRRGDAAGVGEDVGHDDDAPLVEHRLRLDRGGPVGGLHDHLGLDAAGHGLVDGAAEGGRHEQLALEVPDRLGGDRLASAEAGHRAGERHVIGQAAGVEAALVGDGAAEIGDRDDPHARRVQEVAPAARRPCRSPG